MSNKGTLHKMYKTSKVSQIKICEMTGISHATVAKYINTDYQGRYYDKIYNTLKEILIEKGLFEEDETAKNNEKESNEQLEITEITAEKKPQVSKAVNHFDKFNTVIDDPQIIQQAKVTFDNRLITPKNVIYSKVKRGEVYYVAYTKDEIQDDYGHEQRSNRPAIIVSNNVGNNRSPVVEVIYMTTQPKTELPTHVKLTPMKDGIPYESTALCEQVDTIDKRRLTRYISNVSDEKMSEIDQALLISLALDKVNNITTPVQQPVRDVSAYVTRIKMLEERLKELQKEMYDKDTEIAVANAQCEIYRKFFDANIKINN